MALFQDCGEFGGGKTSSFADLLPIRRQSEVHNFEMAQYIDKKN